MEDNLNKNENGRRPQFFLKIKDDLNFLTLEDDLKFTKMEGDLKKTQFKPKAQRSTGNLTNTKNKNILAQMKQSTLIGCDIIVN